MTALRTVVAVVVTLLALGATGITAAADTAVSLLGKGRTHRLVESGVRGASALDALADRPGRASAAHAIVAGLSFATVSAVGVWLLERAWAGTPGWVEVGASVVVSVLLLFVFGEALPRFLASSNPEDSGLAIAPMARGVIRAAYPVARALSAPWRGVVSLVSGEQASEVPWVEPDEARATEESNETGEQDELADAMSDLGEKIVREVMVPRTDMVCLEDTATIDEAISVITAAGVSRVPIYTETLDDIQGVLYAKDLLRCVADTTCSRLVTDHMREALFVPETKPVEELLREMRRRVHIAIVLDEYGGTAGLITIEDLVEEIVGEIFDEYDEQVQLVVDEGGGRYSIDARLPIDDLNELFGTALEVDADTAGGLVPELSGHIPRVGESVVVEGLRFTVSAIEGNRVRKLDVEPAARAGQEEGD
jgi:CBS domain containing-hemolysin-like protein